MKFNKDTIMWDLTQKEKIEGLNLLTEAVKLFRRDGWCTGHLKLTNGQDKFCSIGALDEVGGTTWKKVKSYKNGIIPGDYPGEEYAGKTSWDMKTPSKVFSALALLRNELMIEEAKEILSEREIDKEIFGYSKHHMEENKREMESVVIDFNDSQNDKGPVVDLFWKVIRKTKKELSQKELVSV